MTDPAQRAESVKNGGGIVVCVGGGVILCTRLHPREQSHRLADKCEAGELAAEGDWSKMSWDDESQSMFSDFLGTLLLIPSS